MLKRICVVLLFAFISPLAAQAADITGIWTSTFAGGIGEQNYTFTFKQSGTTLTGNAKSAFGDVVIENGKVEGNMVSFVEKLSVQGMEFAITYKGTIESNGEIKFTRDIPGFGQESLVAKRSP